MQQTALVLDDDMLCRTLLSEILKTKNINVTSFSDPAEFFEASRKQLTDTHFDFILTDNQMPGMTGTEFIKELKSRGLDIPDHRLAIISGSWSSRDLQLAKDVGCEIFTKPYEIPQLYQWLES